MIRLGDVMLEWDVVIDDLRQITAHKIQQYGVGMYLSNSEHFRFWAAYFNIRRKTLRLERLTMLALDGELPAKNKLISDYKDIANYAIMAVQILEERKNGV